jgi:hypothetical protein
VEGQSIYKTLKPVSTKGSTSTLSFACRQLIEATQDASKIGNYVESPPPISYYFASPHILFLCIRLCPSLPTLSALPSCDTGMRSMEILSRVLLNWLLILLSRLFPIFGTAIPAPLIRFCSPLYAESSRYDVRPLAINSVHNHRKVAYSASRSLLPRFLFGSLIDATLAEYAALYSLLRLLLPLKLDAQCLKVIHSWNPPPN